MGHHISCKWFKTLTYNKVNIWPLLHEGMQTKPVKCQNFDMTVKIISYFINFADLPSRVNLISKQNFLVPASQSSEKIEKKTWQKYAKLQFYWSIFVGLLNLSHDRMTHSSGKNNTKTTPVTDPVALLPTEKIGPKTYPGRKIPWNFKIHLRHRKSDPHWEKYQNILHAFFYKNSVLWLRVKYS